MLPLTIQLFTNTLIELALEDEETSPNLAGTHTGLVSVHVPYPAPVPLGPVSSNLSIIGAITLTTLSIIVGVVATGAVPHTPS